MNETDNIEFFGVSVFDGASIINREVYKGIGRPKKSDYMTFIEAQKKLNGYMLQVCGIPKNIACV